MHSMILVIVNLSVRPSVWLSVTLVDCAHMVRPTITISSPYGSQYQISPNFVSAFQRHELQIQAQMQVGRQNVVFSIETACISETASDTAKLTIFISIPLCACIYHTGD